MKLTKREANCTLEALAANTAIQAIINEWDSQTDNGRRGVSMTRALDAMNAALLHSDTYADMALSGYVDHMSQLGDALRVLRQSSQPWYAAVRHSIERLSTGTILAICARR